MREPAGPLGKSVRRATMHRAIPGRAMWPDYPAGVSVATAHEASRFYVYTASGLEALVATELVTSGHSIVAASRREIIVDAPAARILNAPPRLADDVSFELATAEDNARDRQGLAALVAELAGSIPLASPAIASSLTVTVSLRSRRRAFRPRDASDAVGVVLEERRYGTYRVRAPGSTHSRQGLEAHLVLDGQRARLSMNAFINPLHRRPWTVATSPRGLHPPLAAAMAILADIREKQFILDPLSGPGNVLLEAVHKYSDATFVGCDPRPHAVRAAQENDPNNDIRWHLADPAALPLSARTVDRILTAMPKQRAGHFVLEFEDMLTEWRRVLDDEGRLVMAVPLPHAEFLHTHPSWNVDREERVRDGGMTLSIIVASPRHRIETTQG